MSDGRILLGPVDGIRTIQFTGEAA